MRKDKVFSFCAIDEGDRLVCYGSSLEDIKKQLKEKVEASQLEGEISIYSMVGIAHTKKRVNFDFDYDAQLYWKK